MKKKSPVKPRRRWRINPATKVKKSDKGYDRPRAKRRLRKDLEEST